MAVSSWRMRNDVMCDIGAVANGVVKRCKKRGTNRQVNELNAPSMRLQCMLTSLVDALYATLRSLCLGGSISPDASLEMQ